MIQALKIGGERVLLGGASVGFPWGGEAKAGGRTAAVGAEPRRLPVGRG